RIEGIDAVAIGRRSEFLDESAVEARQGSPDPALKTVEAGEILAGREWAEGRCGGAGQRRRHGEADERPEERLDIDRGDALDVTHRGVDVEIGSEIDADARIEIGPSRPIVEIVKAGDVVAGRGLAIGAHRSVERAG